MKVRITDFQVHLNNLERRTIDVFNRGDEPDLPESKAQALIKAGKAEAVEEKKAKEKKK